MWDQRYDREEYVYGKLPNDFLRENYKFLPKGKILFLAEGEGRNAVFLAKHGYSVTAVDSSSVGLKKAEKLAQDNEVCIETHCADLAEFDLGENKWDGIVSIYCHLGPQLRKDLYKRVELALKPSGVFFLEGYRPDQLQYKTGGSPLAEMMTSKATLAMELPNLVFQHLCDVDRKVEEGIYHKGLAAVVQAVATRKE